jgi:hypothetical protein
MDLFAQAANPAVSVSFWVAVGGAGAGAVAMAARLISKRRANSTSGVSRDAVALRIEKAKIEMCKKSDERYVPRDVCQVIHAQVQRDLGELKAQTAEVPKIKAGIDLLLRHHNIENGD